MLKKHSRISILFVSALSMACLIPANANAVSTKKTNGNAEMSQVCANTSKNATNTFFSNNQKNIVVKGIVKDVTGLPLVGVTVFDVNNNSTGTVTDIDGNWSLKLSPKAKVSFACLGYKSLEVEISNKIQKQDDGTYFLEVVLKDDKVALDAAQVVSVGYGTVAKRDLTGSVSSLNMEKTLKAPVSTFDQALTGRVAGVVVTTKDGSLGAEANIVIRGNNSLTQSSAPLYIIDGFPSESSLATSLNSSDIENIDILKDASATAIYGARGANGVIVITTKKGMTGKPRISFSSSLTLNKISNKVDLMDSYDFVKLQSELYDELGGTNIYFKHTEVDPETGATVDLDPFTLEDYKNASTVDWQDKIYRTAAVQNYSVSISGGNKKAGNTYNASFSALDQDGIIQCSNFSRYQGKINFSQKLRDNLTFRMLANYSRSVTMGTNPTAAQQASSATGWLMYSVWGYRPVRSLNRQGDDDLWLDQLIDEDAASSNDYRFNPAKTVRNEYRKTAVDYLSANASLNWKILPSLTLDVKGVYTMNKRRREAFNGTDTYTGYPGSPSGKGINGFINWWDKKSWLNEYILTWKNKFSRDHHFEVKGIFSLQGENADFNGTSAKQMTTETLSLGGLHTGEYQVVIPWEHNWTLMSSAARLNYNYKYKYYLTASFRADGSSKFPKDNRVGYFPSASFAWNFNRENFMKQYSWLSNGKLRMSWGLTGNNRTSTPYDFYSQITTLPGNNHSYDYVIDGKIVSGYFPSNMANDKLKWETTAQTNFGIDLGLFENRIKVTADWYRKDTKDLLLQALIPASSGYTVSMLNIGSMRNTGLELSVETVNLRNRDFEWTSSFNIAFNRNKVTALTDNQKSLFQGVYWDTKYNSQYPYITQVGKPSGLMYGYIYDGTYKADEFTESGVLKDGITYLNSVGKEKVMPGDPKYRDINGDGVVNDDDRTVIGRGQPIHTGGFGNNFYYKGFDLSIFFQWSYGNDVLNANKLIFEGVRKTNINQFASYNDRFNAETAPNSDIPRAGANGLDVYSSRVVEDASFLRLRNITLGYTLPKSVLNKIKINSARFYVSADNILTFTSYSGPDPEVSTRNSVLTPGFDWSAYPRAFGITGGLSITF